MRSFRQFIVEKARRKFSSDEAKALGDKLNVNWDKFSLDQFRKGLEVEGEHDDGSSTDIVDNDTELAKIVLAHLKELPDYYTRLQKVEEDAPVNSISGGNIAGMKEPIIRKVPQTIIKRKKLQ